MVNKVMNVTEDNHMYNELINDFNNATDDNLIIVARSYKNRKDDCIKPLDIKNGIYFYLAYDLDNKTVYPNKITLEQVNKAKENMIRRARLGSMLDLVFSEGDTIDNYISNDPMNVVSLNSKMHGACLLYCDEFLTKIEDKIGKYYIIPSSIHELIFIPQNTIGKSELTNLVIEVNANVVDESEYLADRAFEMNEWVSDNCKKMKTYKVTISSFEYRTVNIVASSPNEAEEIAKEKLDKNGNDFIKYDCSDPYEYGSYVVEGETIVTND